MTSRRWPKGSSPAWKRVRAAVLARDGYRCRLGYPGCTTLATQVHHTAPRELTGDDPTRLLAVCRACNARAGDPTRSDPAPKPSRW